MGLLTADAIKGYRDYTKRTIAYARYKVGGTYHRANVSSSATENGKLTVDFVIDHTLPGNITVTEVQLFDTNDRLWLSKPENIVRKALQEGILYRFVFTIAEG